MTFQRGGPEVRETVVQTSRGRRGLRQKSPVGGPCDPLYASEVDTRRLRFFSRSTGNLSYSPWAGQRAALAVAGCAGANAAMTFGLPGMSLLSSLRGYRGAWLRHDVAAGLAIAAVGLPSAIAYPAIAGLPPETGLYASIAPLVAYAVFGPSRQLIVGPDAATMTVLAAVLAAIAATPAARPTARQSPRCWRSVVGRVLPRWLGVLRLGVTRDLPVPADPDRLLRRHLALDHDRPDRPASRGVKIEAGGLDRPARRAVAARPV